MYVLRWSCTDFDNILMTVTCFEKSEVSQDTGVGRAIWPQGVQCKLIQELWHRRAFLARSRKKNLGL
jgi:hypothetical protein